MKQKDELLLGAYARLQLLGYVSVMLKKCRLKEVKLKG